MRDNVDYRLLGRFRLMQQLNRELAAQPRDQKKVAAAAERRRVPAIELRD